MKKVLAIFAIITVVVWSCSKDQKVVKELEGDWIVSSQTLNGTPVPAAEYAGVKYNFTKCKVRKGDCDGTLTAPDSTKGTLSTAFTYNIQDKGKVINIKFNLFGIIAETITGQIEEHSDSKFVYSYTEPSGNDKIVQTLTKN